MLANSLGISGTVGVMNSLVRNRLLTLFGAAGIVLTACGGADLPAAPADAATNATSAPIATDAPSVQESPATTATPASSTTQAVGDDEEDVAAGYDFNALAPVIESFIDENELNGAGLIIVQRDDGVIYHEHWGEFDEDRISLIASSSKMITAGVLLRLDDDGLLDVDAPVADVAEWGIGNPDITPAQLLSNSSGLVGLLPNPAYGPYLCQYIATGTLQSCAETIFTTVDDDAEIVEPDGEFRYGGAQWQVAGAVADVASGKSWAELIDEIYVQPCGLDVLAYNNHFLQLQTQGFDYPAPFNNDPSTLSATENPNMEGGAYITTGDYGELLLMHLRDGKCGENQVLSGEALDRMHGDRIAEAYDGDTHNAETGYGMGWWVDRPTGRVSDGGAYGSVPWLDLEDGYGAFLVIESNNSTGNELAGQLYDLVEAAVTAS